MAFDPDEYIAGKSAEPSVATAPSDGFDPDAYLSSKAEAFDPDAYLAEKEPQSSAPKQTFSNLAGITMSSAAKGGLEAATFVSRVGAKVGPVALFDTINSALGLPSVSDEIIREMEGASARASDEYGVDPKRTQDFPAQLASGAGSLLPTLASGPLAPFTGAAMMGEQGLQEAKEAGATPTQQVVSAVGNAATGLVTEKLLGLPALMKSVKAAKIPERTAKALIGTVVKQVGLSAAREGTQETLEQISSDTIAKYIAAYDPDRQIFDPKKLATTFAVGAVLGAPVGGLVQTAQTLDSFKEQNQTQAETIDSDLQALATAEPPPLPTQLPPVVQEDIYTAPPTSEADVFAGITQPATQDAQTIPSDEAQVSPGGITEEPSGVPSGEDLQRETPEEPSRSELPQETEFVGTSINTPEGPVTGETPSSAHLSMIDEALSKGSSMEESDLGFAFRKPDGSIEWVDRVEAGRRLTESGQLVGLKPGTKLTSEHLRGEVEGVIFTPKAAKPTQDEAAQAIEPFRDAAIAMAKNQGATDINAEDIFQEVQVELSRQVAEGKTDLSKIGGLVSKAVKNKTANFLQKESRQKRGGGLVESGDIEGPTGETAITEAATTRGPRAESVSQEDIQTIEQAVESLPESERNVMKLMVDNPGMSDAEIGKQVGLTENAVRQAKFRARNKLKEFIKSRGIGERMAPGAANEKEFQRARYIAGTDIYMGLESAGQLTRETWERNMERIYEDAFTPEQLDDAWRVVQLAAHEAKETRKPVTSVISQMMGVEKGREGITALKNAQADRERRERGLPAAFDSARRTQPSVWDEAMRENDETLGKAEEAVIDKLRADFRAVLNDKELFHLLHAKIDAENRYDEAVEQVNEAQTEQERLVAMDKARKAESDFQELLDLAKQVGSEQGRAFAARKFLVSRDYSPLTLTAELQAAQFGEELTDEQKELVTKVSEKVNETQSQFDAREEQLEQEESDKALAEKFREFQKQPVLDSRILAIANKIVAKLDSAADKARQRIKDRAFSFNAGVDPTVLYDLAVIGASKIAHGVRDLAWKLAMRNEFGEGINPYLDDIYKQSDQMIDGLEEEVPEADRPKVRNVVRKTGSKDILQDTEQKIKARVEDGESLSDLRSYVQKMALALVRSGVDSAQALVDAVHPILQKYQPTITKRQAADLISGYGDFRALDKEKSKTQLRDFKTQLQQLSKLEDIAARKPLSKTGIERQVPSDLARRLIREVNELKRKIGVVVTDPTKQLKSAMDSIKTNLKNQIRDLTHQIETGEKPIPGTPTPTDAEIDALKATRDRVKQTLAEIEGKPEQTMEQRVKAAESAMERSIKELENRIKNKDIGPTKNAKVRSDRLDALRAQRDSLSAELDALRAADQDLQDTKTFDRLMKTASELEGKLSRGEVAPKTKAAKIEDELVTQARERVNELRRQMSEARAKTSEAQQKKLDSAIAAVERSIASYDARLKTGAVSATKKGPSVSSPLLERLKAERDVMRRLVEQLRKAPPLSPEQLAIKNLKARIARQNAELQDRIARGDFATRKRKVIDYSKDPEAVRILAENTKWRREFEKAKYEAMLKGQTAMEKIYRGATQTLNTAKTSVGSLDLTAFGRQAAFAVASRPIVAFKTLITSIQAMKEENLNKTNAELELRPNARNGYYRMAKVAFTELDGPLAKREETFRSDWGKHVPWINWSNRQFVTFLNVMRANLFDIMVQSGPVDPSPEQLRAFGRAVNAFTGRGDFGKFEGATDLLAIPYWSPRLYLSRLQTMAGYPIWQKDAKGVRKVIAKEYMRVAASGLAVVLLGLLAGADIEWDPESSDFLKLRFGDVRIDPWGGHQQWLVFLYRMLTGKYETTKGRKFDLDYPNKRPGPYDPTYGDTAVRMNRSKLNPIVQGAWEFQTGKDINGDPVSKTEAVAGSLLPLSIFNDDIGPIAKEYGLDKAAAAQLLNMMGVGVQMYGKDKKN